MGIYFSWGEYREAYHNTPVFYRGSFAAEPGVDTFVDTNGLTKGIVYINGFLLGRYWNIGPQRTLYVPGELLRENNTIVIMELYSPGKEIQVSCIDHSLLCESVSQDETLLGFELK